MLYTLTELNIPAPTLVLTAHNRRYHLVPARNLV